MYIKLFYYFHHVVNINSQEAFKYAYQDRECFYIIFDIIIMQVRLY